MLTLGIILAALLGYCYCSRRVDTEHIVTSLRRSTIAGSIDMKEFGTKSGLFARAQSAAMTTGARFVGKSSAKKMAPKIKVG